MEVDAFVFVLVSPLFALKCARNVLMFGRLIIDGKVNHAGL